MPWRGFNKHADTGYYPREQHFNIAKTVHPAWGVLTKAPKLLHARNVGQILGEDCDTPVKFVVCWTPDGCEKESDRTHKTGGTGTAIVLADRYGIPIYNLYNKSSIDRLHAEVLNKYTTTTQG